MKWEVSIRPEARTDVQAAYDWYEAQCPGLGDEFLIAITKFLFGWGKVLKHFLSIILIFVER